MAPPKFEADFGKVLSSDNISEDAQKKGPFTWKDWAIEVGKHIDEINITLNELRVDVAQLKVKAGIWGLVGGSIPAAITLAVLFLSKYF